MPSFDDESGDGGVYGASRQPASFRSRSKCPWKTVTSALVLFTVGTILLIFGVGSLREDKDRGIAMCVLGSIMFIPGSYATFLIYGAWKRWKGYKWEHIPSYDD